MVSSTPRPSKSAQATSRGRPLEVLVLGLCRTGTMSLKAALEQLGYEKTYHMVSMQENPKHAAKWVEGMKSKYEGDGSLLTREFFNDLLGEYSAVTDVPCASFVTELIAAYPQAKIILSTRSADSWVRSPIRKFIVYFLDSKHKMIPKYMDYLFKYQLYNNFSLYGRRAFEEHNHMVRRVAPPERFLEFEAQDGWVPLCEFLGKEVPEMEYPRTNNPKEFGKRMKTGSSKVICFAAVNALKILGGLVVILWGLRMLLSMVPTERELEM